MSFPEAAVDLWHLQSCSLTINRADSTVSLYFFHVLDLLFPPPVPGPPSRVPGETSGSTHDNFPSIMCLGTTLVPHTILLHGGLESLFERITSTGFACKFLLPTKIRQLHAKYKYKFVLSFPNLNMFPSLSL